MTINGLFMEKGFNHPVYGTRNVRPMVLLFLLCFLGVTISRGAPLVIDHNDIALYQHIPSTTLTDIKKMWINIPGESHSMAYRIGLSLLEQQDANYPVVVTESGNPESYREDALRISRALRSTSSWTYGTGEDTWYTTSAGQQTIKDHLDYCHTHSLAIAALGFGWCWDMTWHNLPGGTEDPVYQVRWAGSSVGGPQGDLRWGLDSNDTDLTGNSICMDTYLTATDAYDQYCITNSYPTRVFFTTGPVDGYTGESGYQRYLKHEHIRHYVLSSTQGVLFDYADILTTNDNGQQNTSSWNSHIYPVIHSDNMKDLDGTYTEDGDHIGQRGALRLGKAQWVLLARLAGWNGSSPSNQAPTLGALQDQTVTEGSYLSFTVSATDPDGHEVTILTSGLPSGATFTGQTFSWVPTYNQSGIYTLTLTASDGLLQDANNLSITVNQANRAPVLSAIGNKQTQAGTNLSFSISATDPDGDSVTYAASGLPSGASFMGQTFSWTPGDSDAGYYTVTFTASDGSLDDSETIGVTVTERDTTAPSVTAASPATDSIQVPLNTVIDVTITDAGEGINPGSVSMVVNGQTVYIGDTDLRQTTYGDCRRLAVAQGYRYVFQPAEPYTYEQKVTVWVNAVDQAGNPMDTYTIDFYTEMRSFGSQYTASAVTSPSDHVAVETDSQGRMWVVWHAGTAGIREIYATLREGNTFGDSVRVTHHILDQCFPDIAVDNDDTAYVVWQDNRRGNWDIYLSTSTNGTSWSNPTRVVDSNDNQTDPQIVVDNAGNVIVAWVDDRVGHQDIFLASSNTLFVSTALHRITYNSAPQSAPSLAVAADNHIYVIWMDQRNGSGDIYGSTSATGWPIVPIAIGVSEQGDPSLALESSGSVMHMLWVDDASGNKDIIYGSSTGLPSSPIQGTNIIDDTTDANQTSPVIMAGLDHAGIQRIYGAWTDGRSLAQTGDTDLYFVEIQAGSGGTNILVEDQGYNSNQYDPALDMDPLGQPYLAWTDDRSSWDHIYQAGATYIHPTALASGEITVLGGRVGTDPNNINSEEDVSVEIPLGAIDHTIQITISTIQNVPSFSYTYARGIEISPSGITFAEPITVTIPVSLSSLPRDPLVYWYNAQTDTLSQTGISDVSYWSVSADLMAVRFRTTHCTPFYILNEPPLATWLQPGGIDGVGSGGCTLVPISQTSPIDMLLPFGGFMIVMIILKRREGDGRSER